MPATPPSPTRQGGLARRGRIRRFIPPQHGAWAMLAVPFGVGVVDSGPSWVHLPLLVAWLGGYLLSYYAFIALKTGRPGRVREQLAVYSAVAIPAAAVALLARPALLVFAPVFAALIAVNAVFARRRDERAIVNDLAAVAAACLMADVAATAGGAPAGQGLLAAGVLFLYFAGTALYVKTMIRERGRASWLAASVAFHAVALGLAWLVAWQLGVVFAWLLGRAVVLPRFALRPRTVGFIEIGHSLVLLVAVPGLT